MLTPEYVGESITKDESKLHVAIYNICQIRYHQTNRIVLASTKYLSPPSPLIVAHNPPLSTTVANDDHPSVQAMHATLAYKS